MSELKCPFCQQKLDYDDLLGSCINEHCEESFDMVGTESLWQKVIDLKQELDCTRKALEQSETCCTEWEKQALDYKAENIALSGELERTRKALDVAVDALKKIGFGCGIPPDENYAYNYINIAADAHQRLQQELEQKD